MSDSRTNISDGQELPEWDETKRVDFDPTDYFVLQTSDGSVQIFRRVDLGADTDDPSMQPVAATPVAWRGADGSGFNVELVEACVGNLKQKKRNGAEIAADCIAAALHDWDYLTRGERMGLREKFMQLTKLSVTMMDYLDTIPARRADGRDARAADWIKTAHRRVFRAPNDKTDASQDRKGIEHAGFTHDKVIQLAGKCLHKRLDNHLTEVQAYSKDLQDPACGSLTKRAQWKRSIQRYQSLSPVLRAVADEMENNV